MDGEFALMLAGFVLSGPAWLYVSRRLHGLTWADRSQRFVVVCAITVGLMALTWRTNWHGAWVIAMSFAIEAWLFAAVCRTFERTGEAKAQS